MTAAPRLLTALLVSSALALPAYAQGDKVGVLGAGSAVTATADGATRTLKAGDALFLGDVVETGQDGKAQLIFLDRSSVTLKRGTALTIDRFVYDPATSGGAMALSGAKGAFRFIGGALSKKQPVTIATPVGTIGIRGGIADATIAKGGATQSFFLYGEEMTLTNRQGEISRLQAFGTGLSLPTPGATPAALPAAAVTRHFDQFRPTPADPTMPNAPQAGQIGSVIGDNASRDNDNSGTERGEGNPSGNSGRGSGSSGSNGSGGHDEGGSGGSTPSGPASESSSDASGATPSSSSASLNYSNTAAAPLASTGSLPGQPALALLGQTGGLPGSSLTIDTRNLTIVGAQDEKKDRIVNAGSAANPIVQTPQPTVTPPTNTPAPTTPSTPSPTPTPVADGSTLTPPAALPAPTPNTHFGRYFSLLYTGSPATSQMDEAGSVAGYWDANGLTATLQPAVGTAYVKHIGDVFSPAGTATTKAPGGYNVGTPTSYWDIDGEHFTGVNYRSPYETLDYYHLLSMNGGDNSQIALVSGQRVFTGATPTATELQTAMTSSAAFSSASGGVAFSSASGGVAFYEFSGIL